MFGHQNNDDVAVNGLPPADTIAPPHEPETIAPTAGSVPMPAPVPDHTNDFAPADDHAAASSVPPITSPAPSVVTDHSSTPNPAASNDLLELKQSALQELSPLIGHLEQSPEEKFRTTMMMIQASDDQSMLPAALEAAKQIHEEKARAQALLDVVNEINYFTQQHENNG